MIFFFLQNSLRILKLIFKFYSSFLVFIKNESLSFFIHFFEVFFKENNHEQSILRDFPPFYKNKRIKLESKKSRILEQEIQTLKNELKTYKNFKKRIIIFLNTKSCCKISKNDSLNHIINTMVNNLHLKTNFNNEINNNYINVPKLSTFESFSCTSINDQINLDSEPNNNNDLKQFSSLIFDDFEKNKQILDKKKRKSKILYRSKIKKIQKTYQNLENFEIINGYRKCKNDSHIEKEINFKEIFDLY